MACAAVVAVAGACSLVPAPPEELPVPESAPEPLQASVWTADSVSIAPGLLLPAHARLTVVAERDGLIDVRCDECADAVGGQISWDRIVGDPQTPQVASYGTLAEFAHAVRNAAARHDLRSLASVMSPQFSYSFVGVQSPENAFAVWRSEDYRTLEQAAAVLDSGLTTRDGRIWSAPRAFNEEYSYRGLRIGFRKNADDRWEWIYLISGIAP